MSRAVGDAEMTVDGGRRHVRRRRWFRGPGELGCSRDKLSAEHESLAAESADPLV
jgi:hypothetical protein